MRPLIHWFLCIDDSGGWLLNVTVEFDIANSLESVSGKLLLSVPEVSSLIEIPLTLTHENIVAVVIFPVGQVSSPSAHY